MTEPREAHFLFVHGVGEQGSDFAADAIKNLRGALATKGVKLHAGVVHWAPLADGLERAFLSTAEARGSSGNLTQRLVVGTLADALVYQANARLREQIGYLLDYEYTRLRAGSVHIVAHSLGGLIALDWLRSRKNVRPLRLWTIGSNVGLFNLGQRFDCPASVVNDGTWVNMFYPSDFLGYPLNAQPEFRHVRDVKLPRAGFFRMSTLVPGLRHTDYWTDAKLWRKTVPGLL